MPTYYVEDYDGERNDDADVTARVVEPERVKNKVVAKKTASNKSA